MGNSFAIKTDIAIKSSNTEGQIYYDPSGHQCNAGEELVICEFKVKVSGTYKISAEIASGEGGKTMYMRLYVNNNKIKEISYSSTSYTTKAITFNVEKGDIVKLTIYSSEANAFINSIKLIGYIVPGVDIIS